MRLRPALKDKLESPLAWILAVALVLRVVGIGWGLPASDGWDNDGVAPRDFLAGLVRTFTPGQFFTYPPAHLIALFLLTSPVTAIALGRAHSLSPPDVIREIIRVPYMTIIAGAARLTTVILSLGIVYVVARMAEELRGRRAGWCAAAVCAINAPFTYYSKTSNLDVPYLFWTSLALLALMRAVARGEPERLRTLALLAALAVSTKDQAYAVFALGVPATLALWFALDPWARAHARRVLRELVIATLAGAAAFLALDAVVVNPSGFRARLRFLVGPASQDFVNYTSDWPGTSLVLRDSLAMFSAFYPWAFAAFVVLGVAIWARSYETRPTFVAGFVPLLGALSFTLAFNCIARRTEHRFLLPQALLVAVHAGIGVDWLVLAGRARMARLYAQGAVGAAFAVALFACANVDANLLLDPRYDAERWMQANIAAGDSVEVYGLNVYLPRLPSFARVTRVGLDPLERRNPLPGVVEVQDAYGRAEQRRPHFLVVSEGWVWRYRFAPDLSGGALEPGRARPPTFTEHTRDTDGVAFFRGLFDGTRGFRLAHTSSFRSRVWSPVNYHSSTSRTIWIFKRVD